MTRYEQMERWGDERETDLSGLRRYQTFEPIFATADLGKSQPEQPTTDEDEQPF